MLLCKGDTRKFSSVGTQTALHGHWQITVLLVARLTAIRTSPPNVCDSRHTLVELERFISIVHWSRRTRLHMRTRYVFQTMTLTSLCFANACARTSDSRSAHGAVDSDRASGVQSRSATSIDIPGDSARRSVESRFDAYLRIAMLTSPVGVPDSLISCDPDGETDNHLALARYRILSSQVQGDSALVTFAATTVAEVRPDTLVANREDATLRVRIDTLHWIMTRDSATKHWGVCGYSTEGVGFTHDSSDENVRWKPAGASWVRARALADSVKAAPPS